MQVKVPSPLRKVHSKGKGTKVLGGRPAHVGHLYGFGNTEEELRLQIFGTKAWGKKADGPLNHETGKGWVHAVKGDYADALSKGHIVNDMIVESTGGIAPHTRSVVRRLSRRAEGKGATDRTKYGTARASTRSFATHHLQRMTKAAVVYDARAIRKQVIFLKQRAFGCAAVAADAAADGGVEA